MNAKQTAAVAMPGTDRVETRSGTLSFDLRGASRLVVTSGRDVGWFRHGDASWYVAQGWERTGDGWRIREREEGVVRGVVDDAAGGPEADPETSRAVLALVEAEVRRWVEDRVDLLALAGRAEARYRVYESRERIASLRRQIAEEETRLERRQDSLKEADREVARTKPVQGVALAR